MQWRIADFPGEGAPTPQGGCQHTILPYFPKNCMKLKEFGPPGGVRVPRAPLDLPLQCSTKHKQRIFEMHCKFYTLENKCKSRICDRIFKLIGKSHFCNFYLRHLIIFWGCSSKYRVVSFCHQIKVFVNATTLTKLTYLTHL